MNYCTIIDKKFRKTAHEDYISYETLIYRGFWWLKTMSRAKENHTEYALSYNGYFLFVKTV